MAENNTEVTKVAINDIGTEEDFIKAVDSTIKNFDDGDLVEGTVVKIDHDEVLLDIGYKTEGVIPSRELSIKKDVDPDEVVEVGDTIEALVVTKEDKEGRLILSKKRAQYERAWGDIEKIKEADGVVEGTVIEAVKGGLIVDIGLRGFLPASLVEMRRVRDLSPYIGQKIKAKILELDKNRNNVVLSRRQYLEETQSEVRETFLSQLKKGQIREGVVSSIVNFGAFVDLGGVDGLIHVSELSWKHIDHPSEVVKVGDKVTVEVLDVDLDRERISLSLKATQEDPWQRFARTHVPGQIVKGKVTKIVQFGVFISVEDGIEGLVHISELANRHVENPETVVKPGETVFVKVIDVDLDRRRISLSLKQANDSLTRLPRTSIRPSTACRPSTTSRATTSTPKASTRTPTSGSLVTRSSARSGSLSTPPLTSCGRSTRSSWPRSWRTLPNPQPPTARARRKRSRSRRPPTTLPLLRLPVPSPTPISSPPCATSCSASEFAAKLALSV